MRFLAGTPGAIRRVLTAKATDLGILVIAMEAKNVVVLGAGTMGSGIAAHLANVGLNVTLLDVTAQAARDAFERAKAVRPPHFFVPEIAARIRLGGIDEHLDWVKEADWVCEAIVENLELKRALFERLDSILKPETLVSTNTSGLQIALLIEGRSESFKKRLIGTHFFNPPRYLKLLELIPTPDSDPVVVATLTKFLEDRVARRVVPAKDTPGFIANRYGMWSMFLATHVTERLHLPIEAVDAITGPFLGRPRSGTFRLNDLVGLDIMRDIAANLRDRCPMDPHIKWLDHPSSLSELLEKGWIGTKAGQGYYRKEGKDLLAFDLETHAYRELIEPNLPSLKELAKLPLAERLRQGLDRKDEVGEYLRLYLVPALQYAATLMSEISHNAQDFDRVMKWGFGWEMGPFEMIDAIGPEKLGLKPTYEAGMVSASGGGRVPILDEPQYRTLNQYPLIEAAGQVMVRDLGDGVRAFSLNTKQGSVNPQSVADLNAFLDKTPESQPLVFTGEGKNFSVGFDLRFFLERIDSQDWPAIEEAILALQKLGERLEARPIVAAIQGYALGGGFELALSCPRMVVQCEAQVGLPEAKVGLIPTGRGATLVRLNNQSNAKHLATVCATLTEGVIASNAVQAQQLGYLRPTDVVCFHPDRVLHDAKQLALTKPVTSRPDWNAIVGPLTGMIDQAQNELKAKGVMTEYDEVVGDRLKQVFAKVTSYQDALDKERSAFHDLCTNARTRARVAHMLETGKPLRN